MKGCFFNTILMVFGLLAVSFFIGDRLQKDKNDGWIDVKDKASRNSDKQKSIEQLRTTYLLQLKNEIAAMKNPLD